MKGKGMENSNNNNTVLKILIGVIILLSAILLISGIFYVHGIHGKINKLEKEQQEQLKKQVEAQKVLPVQVAENKQNEIKTGTTQNSTATVNNTNNTNSDNNASALKKGSIFITRSTSGPVNVRAEASMNSEIIERLRDNVILKYVSRKGNWYYISYNIRGYNEYGYIHKSQMTR